LSAAIVCSLFITALYQSYDWLLAHHFDAWGTRVYLKVFWAAIFTFAIDRNFERLGLHLPRRETIVVGMTLPLVILLAWYGLAGINPGWDAPWLLHNLNVGISEELLCHGGLLVLLRSAGKMGSAYIANIFFACLHFPGLLHGNFSFDDFQNATMIFAFGIFLAGTRFYTNSLLPGVILHALLDYMGRYYNPAADVYSHVYRLLIGRANPELRNDVWCWTTDLLFFAVGAALIFASGNRTLATKCIPITRQSIPA
jgi:membrane protease YdiL (CAAX protease family)